MYKKYFISFLFLSIAHSLFAAITCPPNSAHFCNVCVDGNVVINGTGGTGTTGCTGADNALVVAGDVGIGGNLNVCGLTTMGGARNVSHAPFDSRSIPCAGPSLQLEVLGDVGIENNLYVCGTIVANGFSGPIVGGTGATGATGATGPTGATGIFSASYGQLSVTSQAIFLETTDDFLPIPFNATGPSSNMGVSTTSPATITIEQDGVYQINFSLYFSVENSDEDVFTISTYTFGLNVNGVTTPAAAVYASDPGSLSLNYSTIMEFSASDQIQFYMESSAGEDIFANNVTLENGNAYLIQISN